MKSVTFYCFTLFAFVCAPLASYGLESTKLILAGPSAVVSYPLMVMAKQQTLAKSGINLEFVRWKNPDQLRAMVIDKQVDFSAMPSNLAAIFYNRGHKLSLVNISVWNIMSIVSKSSTGGKSLKSLADLLGKEIVVPFKNDMPSIILQRLLQAQLGDKAKHVSIRQSHNLADAAQLLLANKVEHALLIEPLSSVVLYQSQKKIHSHLVSSLNISEQWRQTFPNAPKLPQAGIIANTTVSHDKKLIEKINQSYITSANWCNYNPGDCADLVREYLPKMPKKALISAIKNTQLNPISALQARPDLEKFYSLLANTNAKRIGGNLPDENFYK